MMDVDAKNLSAWRFGDILAYDPDGNGSGEHRSGVPSILRCMFICASGPDKQFLSLDLADVDDIPSVSGGPRSRQWWVRIEKAE